MRLNIERSLTQMTHTCWTAWIPHILVENFAQECLFLLYFCLALCEAVAARYTSSRTFSLVCCRRGSMDTRGYRRRGKDDGAALDYGRGNAEGEQRVTSCPSSSKGRWVERRKTWLE